MSATTAASRTIEIAVDHPAFDGHFPGRPVLPGVALLAEVLEAARREPALVACVGSEPRLAVVKFLAPVGPGATLTLDFVVAARALEWRVADGARAVASGRFARADVGAETLR
ncbi:MAG TPA: 3-hydroxyacyl-ACP dehydratase [Caldimonas sp.]|nr:3-hydroxyacyl-ACP dehydratase [Caldimonas sp.]